MVNIRSLLAGDSIRNVGVLLSGSFISQILPIAFFPILSRLYSPADYGVLAIFMSISVLLMVVSNLQLNLAILIPKKEEEALRIFYCANFVVVGFSLVVLLVTVSLSLTVFSTVATELRGWILLLPLALFVTGINVQFVAWFNRLGRFKILSSSRIGTSVITVAASLLLSFFLHGPGGLIISYILGHLAAFIFFTIIFLSEKKAMKLGVKESVDILKKYYAFPLYTMPTELVSNLSQQLPLFLFTLFSGVNTVGLFSRSRQILALPSNYISSSMGEIYKQKASVIYQNSPEELKPLFVKTLTYLIIFSVIPFLTLGLFSPSLFAFFFGENWRAAGVFSQGLVFMYFFRFVISPLTFNLYLYGKQRLDFVLHLLIIVLSILSMYVGLELLNSDILAIILFSSSYSFVYIIYGFLSYKVLKVKHSLNECV